MLLFMLCSCYWPLYAILIIFPLLLKSQAYNFIGRKIYTVWLVPKIISDKK